jgi:hypothetical protein
MISCPIRGKIKLLQRRMNENILKFIRIVVTKFECFGDLPKKIRKKNPSRDFWTGNLRNSFQRDGF